MEVNRVNIFNNVKEKISEMCFSERESENCLHLCSARVIIHSGSDNPSSMQAKSIPSCAYRVAYCHLIISPNHFQSSWHKSFFTDTYIIVFLRTSTMNILLYIYF